MRRSFSHLFTPQIRLLVYLATTCQNTKRNVKSQLKKKMTMEWGHAGPDGQKECFSLTSNQRDYWTDCRDL